MFAEHASTAEFECLNGDTTARSQRRGHHFFVEGYVHSVIFDVPTVNNWSCCEGKVLSIDGKHATPHRLLLNIECNTQNYAQPVQLYSWISKTFFSITAVIQYFQHWSTAVKLLFFIWLAIKIGGPDLTQDCWLSSYFCFSLSGKCLHTAGLVQVLMHYQQWGMKEVPRKWFSQNLRKQEAAGKDLWNLSRCETGNSVTTQNMEKQKFYIWPYTVMSCDSV